MKLSKCFLFLLACLVMLGLVSCEKKDGAQNNFERYVLLDEADIRMGVGSKTTIRPQFAEGAGIPEFASWICMGCI